MSRLLDFCTIDGHRIEIREDAPDAFSVHDTEPFNQDSVPSVWPFKTIDQAAEAYLICRDAARKRRTFA